MRLADADDPIGVGEVFIEAGHDPERVQYDIDSAMAEKKAREAMERAKRKAR